MSRYKAKKHDNAFKFARQYMYIHIRFAPD